MWLTSEQWLDVLFWASVVMSIPLLGISMDAVGKHLADLQYQIVKKLNGIRWIQSWINLRIHSNRVLFAAIFLTTGILGIADADDILRAWVGRSLFLGLLVIYTISASLDWKAEAKQVEILAEHENQHNIPRMRLNLHSGLTQMTVIVGLIDLSEIKEADRVALRDACDRVTVLLKSVQNDLHDLDPSYKVDKHV